MIHPSPKRPRPFERLAKNSGDRMKLLQAEHDAVPVLLNDWTHDLSETIYARYFKTGAFPHCVDSLLANGLGRVECLPDYILKAGTGLGLETASSGDSGSSPMSSDTSSMSMTGMKKRMDMSGSGMPADVTKTETSLMDGSMQMTSISPMSSMAPTSLGMAPMTSNMASMPSMGSMSSMPGMSSLDARGCTPPMMFRPGYNVKSLPPATCANTTSSLLTIPANFTQGWLALSLVNSGAVSKLAVSLDPHSMYVYAADGLYVSLQEVKVRCNPSYCRIKPVLTQQGPLSVDWPAIFGYDQAGPIAWRLLPSIFFLPNG